MSQSSSRSSSKRTAEAWEAPVTQELSARSRSAANGLVLAVALDLLDDNPYQHRAQIDPDKLEELAASIKDHGLLQSVTARRTGDRWQVIAGHRRLSAFRLLRERAANEDECRRWAEIPIQEKVGVSDEQMMLYGAVENLQRDDPSPVEAAGALAQYQAAADLSVQQLAEHTGLEVDRVKRLMRLHQAPDVIKAGVVKGLMVPVVDEGTGEPVLNKSGKPRNEHRRLDMMAALEFARAFAHWSEEAPKKAAARTEAAIMRALQDNWTYRRIRTWCQGVISGRPQSESPEPSATKSVALFKDKDGQLVVFRSRLAGSTDAQRRQLGVVLETLLAEVGQSARGAAKS